ncbi:hypothetical protein HYC85_016753 [Camellia sinensis]|uniref:Protein SCAI n=1 Tax=Camellia sinensis TaxID=4442 RepID=A0A7J7H1S2_CAMSI|nr:hypothetical protein HYC85_016753 [Camellia sinensis]
MSQNNIPVSEIYWSLVDKADKKFSKIRDLPYYERNRYDTYFYKVFKVYTQLWKFQQENRQKLVEAGLKRWEIGDIASRIGQLYFGQYMRTSDASYLSESYIFYEAVLTREYFKDGLFQDLNLANKQLRFLARFLMVCLVLNRREMVYQLDTNFKEWKLVVQEIVKFLKVDTAFMNIRPLRYSLVLDLHPDLLPHVAAARRKLRLRDAILTSYYPNEVKFSELTLDTFRMLQCLEWEPSGSFYKSSGAPSSGTATNIAQNGAPGPSRINYSQDITDPTLPPNPRKAVLYRPTVTQFIAVGSKVLKSGRNRYGLRNGFGGYRHPLRPLLQAEVLKDEYGACPWSARRRCCQVSTPGVRGRSKWNLSGHCSILQGMKHGYSKMVPYEYWIHRIHAGYDKYVWAINGAEKGEPAALLLSPSSSSIMPHPNGSLFTSFLTAPLQAFCLLLGISGSDSETDTCNKAENLLSSLLNDWGMTLAASDTLDPVWAQVLSDPFLRRLLLRFIFCRAVLTLYAPTFNKKEFLPECMPCLPEAVLPLAATSQTAILQIANLFSATNSFIFSEGITLPESNDESMSSSS